MTPRTHERRADSRRCTVGEHGVLTTRIAPTHHARLVDVSAGGALLDTPLRLLPGSSIEVCFATKRERIAIRGEVVRCGVARLGPVVYRGAVRFEHRVSLFDGWTVEQQLPAGERITRGVL